MAAADPVKPADMSAKKRSSLRVSKFLNARAANINSFVQGGFLTAPKKDDIVNPIKKVLVLEFTFQNSMAMFT